MAVTIDYYLTLSIKDCRQMGFLAPDSVKSGTVNWLTSGRKVASVAFMTDTRQNVASLSFLYDGEPVSETIVLSFQRSNLKGCGRGYYYFVCPVTGRRCRKLYLVNGRFVSRSAFRPLYASQVLSKRQRNSSATKRLDLLVAFDRCQRQRFRRETYKGKPTPYGRKVGKLLDLMERYFG